MKILQINASVRVEGSQSTRLASRIVERLTEQHANAHVVIRDLAVTPHPALDGVALQALFTPAEERTPEQLERVSLDDVLIDELKSAETIVLGVPMYNLHIPSQLKNWFDAIARAKVTFEYTENGPKGLLQRHANRYAGAVSEDNAWFSWDHGCACDLCRGLGNG